MSGELIPLGIFLLTELILAVWWASKIDTQVKAQWRIIDDLGKHFIKLPELVVKVDTMWIFQMRRGVSEVVDKGIGERNSPLKFNEEARAKLDPIKDELIKYYSEHKIMDDYEMLLLIEE
jgi:hypothetical protein